MIAAIIILWGLIVLGESWVLIASWLRGRYRIVRRLCKPFTLTVKHHPPLCVLEPGQEAWTCWLWWSWRPLTDAERAA